MTDKKGSFAQLEQLPKQGELANLSDEIRRTMAKIGSGRGTPDDLTRVSGLMNRRVNVLYWQGLKSARARARRNEGGGE